MEIGVRARFSRSSKSGSDPDFHSGLGFGLALDLALDGLARDLRRRAGIRRLAVGFAHAVLESAHRAAKVGADVAQLLGAENHQHDDQQDHPMCNAPSAHNASYLFLEIMGPRGSGPPMTCIWT